MYMKLGIESILMIISAVATFVLPPIGIIMLIAGFILWISNV